MLETEKKYFKSYGIKGASNEARVVVIYHPQQMVIIIMFLYYVAFLFFETIALLFFALIDKKIMAKNAASMNDSRQLSN
jgi:hypothetical protein